MGLLPQHSSTDTRGNAQHSTALSAPVASALTRSARRRHRRSRSARHGHDPRGRSSAGWRRPEGRGGAGHSDYCTLSQPPKMREGMHMHKAGACVPTRRRCQRTAAGAGLLLAGLRAAGRRCSWPGSRSFAPGCEAPVHCWAGCLAATFCERSACWAAVEAAVSWPLCLGHRWRGGCTPRPLRPVGCNIAVQKPVKAAQAAQAAQPPSAPCRRRCFH